VTFSDRLDAMLRPFADLILEAAHLSSEETVLDIGCGGGALSLLTTNKAKSVLGVDISRPLIALARDRSKSTKSAAFQHGDASNITLDVGNHLLKMRGLKPHLKRQCRSLKLCRHRLSHTPRVLLLLQIHNILQMS